MNILIAGDFVPTNVNFKDFEEGDIQGILGSELFSIWRAADFRIFNLEAPIVDGEDPIEKRGPNLRVPLKCAPGLKALNPNLLTLANNHIMDQGVEGLNSTVNLLNELKIPYIGVGSTSSVASTPAVFEINGIRVGFYACAEHEFSIVSEDLPGANPFEPLDSLDHIVELKRRSDYVVVLYHGGKECYRYPSPRLQRTCRKMIEKGAKLVVCQHSHCIGSFEEFEEGTIVYGQGNFIFNKYDNEFWNSAVILNVNLEAGFQVSYIPIVKNGSGIHIADEFTANTILSEFQTRSEAILNPDFVRRNYQDFALVKLNAYLRDISGQGKWVARTDRRILRGYLLRQMFNQSKLLAVKNFLECEAHRELILAGLEARFSSTFKINSGDTKK